MSRSRASNELLRDSGYPERRNRTRMRIVSPPTGRLIQKPDHDQKVRRQFSETLLTPSPCDALGEGTPNDRSNELGKNEGRLNGGDVACAVVNGGHVRVESKLTWLELFTNNACDHDQGAAADSGRTDAGDGSSHDETRGVWRKGGY